MVCSRVKPTIGLLPYDTVCVNDRDVWGVNVRRWQYHPFWIYHQFLKLFQTVSEQRFYAVFDCDNTIY